ncbi:hypothetical protein FXO38_08433 [Capsicum annuum]|nr:hypothetical protein FXO38_08433 [Capsicum annuum]
MVKKFSGGRDLCTDSSSRFAAPKQDMAQLHFHEKFKMVTKPDDFLKLWWDHMSAKERKIVRTNIGYLSYLIEMDAWPEMIHVLTTFWDNQNMVFCFGDVELTPTIEEVLLGTMVFPQGENSTIHPRVVSVTHPLFFGMEYNSKKGNRPYNLGKVLRQFEIKQETPQIDSMLRFFTKYDESELPLKEYMINGWRIRRWTEVSFRIGYKPEDSDTYKEWFKKSLIGTLILGPKVPTQVVDVEFEHQI